MIETQTHAPSPDELGKMLTLDQVETDHLANLYPGAEVEVAKELEGVLGDVFGKDPDQYARDLKSGKLTPEDVQPGELSMPYLRGREFHGKLPKNIRFLERPTETGYPLSLMVGVEEDGNRLVIGTHAYAVSENTANYILSKREKSGSNGREEPVRPMHFDDEADPRLVIDKRDHFKLTGQ